MSGNPEDEWFTDGMTETLITDLSRVPNLIVISRESTFTYKGKSVDVRQVAKELNVRYVLEGSIQRTSDRLRVNAQLIDATTGKHLWADRYDRPLDDIFAIQDELAGHIMNEVDIQVVSGPQARVLRGSTRDRRAYEMFLRALRHFFTYTQEGFARAEELMTEALKIDPDFTAAMTLLGWVYYHQGDAGWRRDSAQSYQMALEMAHRATKVDPLNGNGYSLASSTLLNLKRYEDALAAADKAVSVAPNQADVTGNVAWTYATSGRAEEALTLVNRAFRLNPYAPPWLYGARGDSLLWTGRVDEALPVLHKCSDPLPEFIWCRLGLAVAYVKAGRPVDARTQARAALRINPSITAEDNAYTRAMRVPGERAEVVKALREAGLK
jgi:adenylate cyclase